MTGGVEDEVFASWYPELEEEKLLRYRGSEQGSGPGDFDVQRFKVRFLGVLYGDMDSWAGPTSSMHTRAQAY